MSSDAEPKSPAERPAPHNGGNGSNGAATAAAAAGAVNGRLTAAGAGAGAVAKGAVNGSGAGSTQTPTPTPTRTLAEIAAAVGGTVEGDGSLAIRGINGIREAGRDELTFLADDRYVDWLAKTGAAAVIVRNAPAGPARPEGKTVVRVADPEAAIQAAQTLFVPPPSHPPAGIHPTAIIHETAVIGRGVAIGPHVVIEAHARIGDRCVLYPGVFVGAHTTVGDDCLIYPNVTLRDRITVGKRVILHPNCVIGADGFGYKAGPTGLQKIPHHGTVVLEDDVEIGAGSCIDRARFAQTRIGMGTKIDNLVQIAHNVTVGRFTAISGMTGIAGSTTIGSMVTIGGHCGIADHIRIGDRAMLAAMTGVTKDLEGGQIYSDAPAWPHRQAARNLAIYRRLPEIADDIRTLKARLAELEKLLAAAGTNGAATGTPSAAAAAAAAAGGSRPS
jgi:UDP-3-O-[3-hydroxymyristoyl] glucosamine N-acyltransferase